MLNLVLIDPGDGSETRVVMVGEYDLVGILFRHLRLF